MMEHDTSLLVICPGGHQLRSPERAIGKSLPCPVCRQMVHVEKAKPSLSDTGVLRILDVRIAAIAAKQPSPQPVARRDDLSDTGVMRILGDFMATPESVMPADVPNLRPCPVCSAGVADASSVCKHCHCYVGVSPDFLRQMSDDRNVAS